MQAKQQQYASGNNKFPLAKTRAQRNVSCALCIHRPSFVTVKNCPFRCYPASQLCSRIWFVACHFCPSQLVTQSAQLFRSTWLQYLTLCSAAFAPLQWLCVLVGLLCWQSCMQQSANCRSFARFRYRAASVHFCSCR